MEILDPSDEFRPIDDEKLEFLFSLIDSCEKIESLPALDEQSRNEMAIIKHNFLVVISQAMAGYHLYKTIASLSKDLYVDLNEIIEKTLPPVRPMSLRNYEKALSEFGDFSFDS
jgi:hypothetical protein